MTKRQEKNNDNPPMHLMMAWAESGIPRFRDFMDLDSRDVERWVWYAMHGPSQARTQLLLAQLIQIVSSIGGKPPRTDQLLPWLKGMEDDPESAAANKRKKSIQKRTMADIGSMLDDVIAKRKRSDG